METIDTGSSNNALDVRHVEKLKGGLTWAEQRYALEGISKDPPHKRLVPSETNQRRTLKTGAWKDPPKRGKEGRVSSQTHSDANL